MTAKLKAMAHQLESLKFMKGKKAVFDASDPGTGKTFVEIMDFVQQHKKDGKAMLVVCPKSLMRAAWANDIKKFAPHLRVSLCYAGDRMDALNAEADVYIINVDGVKDLLKINSKKFWNKFGRLVIDESTAFKHHTSQRSKAMSKIASKFEYRRCMSGTPSSNGICDLWHQYYILDNGKRLGTSYFGFRNAVCTPIQNGPQAQHIKWVDKPGVEVLVAELVKDITIRHKFEDCVDIPENYQYALPVQLSPSHMATYNELKENSLAVMRETTVTAINAAVLATKLLQAASGAVYNDAGGYSLIGTDRYEIALDLVEERQHTIVFYHWDHQLEELVKEAKKRQNKKQLGDFAVWDPDQPQIADEFQEGKYQVLFANPQSAAHGLTLTKGTASIWASPTYNLEHFSQGYKRVYRLGQVSKTENIVLVAEGTVDEKVWAALQVKQISMTALLNELQEAA